MNEKNTEHLLKTYPDLYEHNYNFACGDGWFNLIETLSSEIQSIVDKIGPHGYCEVSDVKEKYGTLRFYAEASHPEIEKLIDKAESESSKICEICGSPGTIRGSVWFSTYCDNCAEK